MASPSALVPPSVVALLGAALLSRVVNRRPLLWERLVVGLRYYGLPSEGDVERVLEAAMKGAVAPHQPPAGAAAAAPLASLITDAVAVRSRTVAYSYFPVRSLPWEAMAGRDSIAAVCLTAAYAAIATTVIASMVRLPPVVCGQHDGGG